MDEDNRILSRQLRKFIVFCIEQEPLLKIEIRDPALLAGNWTQLCATCKVFVMGIIYFIW